MTITSNTTENNAYDQVPSETLIMDPPKKGPKPQEPDNLADNPQEPLILSSTSAPKRPKLAPQLSVTIPKSSVVSSEPIENDSETVLSPGHASGYIQWKKASVPDLANETEEEGKNRLNKRHAPKGKRGTRCIDDGTIDRSSALVGKPDPSKLVISFRTEKTDENTNEISESDVTFQYKDETKDVQVDWNDAKSIQKLNSWRNQIIRRTIGKPYDNKDFWTVQEQQIITGIVRDYLNDGKDIDWIQISHDYNQLIRDMEQKKGTPGAPRRYRCQDGDKTTREAVSISIPLREHRRIPQRTGWLLLREMNQFLAPDAIEVMDRIRSSSYPQRNGSPPAKSGREERRSARQSKGKAASQASSEEQEDSLVSSTYENDRSVINSPSESTPKLPLSPLTQPRPLQPRPKVVRPPVAKPPPRRYKKRTAYNEEIVYDKPYSDSSHHSTNLNTKQTSGSRQHALDTLAEQAAIMYDHLPEAQKWAPPRSIAPDTMESRTTFAAYDSAPRPSFPARPESRPVSVTSATPGSFELIPSVGRSNSTPLTLQESSLPQPVIARTPSFNLSHQRTKLPVDSNDQTLRPGQSLYLQHSRAAMAATWELEHQLQDAANTMDVVDTDDTRVKKPSPSEPEM